MSDINALLSGIISSGNGNFTNYVNSTTKNGNIVYQPATINPMNNAGTTSTTVEDTSGSTAATTA
jgi:hypothetical protein